jgi:uncharacterized OsmC-like protein
MDANALRAAQGPLKQKYRHEPASAQIAARAEVRLDPAQLLGYLADRPQAAGLHVSTGGTGKHACSADLLLEALAACAAVTLMAVAMSMGCKLTGGRIIAESSWDARGTLGIDKTVPVGLKDISLKFELEGDIDEPLRQRLIDTTERYCVILATLRDPPQVSVVLET